jgi:hypothetical protein
MADRTDFYFRQRVTEAELDLAFELLEKADRDLAADIGVYGIISGAVPSEHQPVPDLTVDLVAPGRAYDHAGQRIFFGTDQAVDCAVDHVGIPTDVSSSSNERWLGVFLKFDRLFSDPRTDGNSQQVLFRRDESFQVVVRQAAEGSIGAAPKVPLVEDELLVCDVLRRAGQTQILDADIDTARRQAFVFAQGDAVEIVSGLWNILQPAVNTVQSALDEVDAELNDHFGATARRHGATDVDYAPHGFVAGDNLQAALNELIDDLSTSAGGNPGAQRVGADAATGTPHALPSGNVDGQLSLLLGWLNSHVGATAGAHNASAIAAASHNHISGPSVQAQLQEIVDDLQSQSASLGASQVGDAAISGSPNSLSAGTVRAQLTALLADINNHQNDGTDAHDASAISVADAGGNLSANNVEAALAEILNAFEDDHYRGNQSNAGRHKAIHQPDLGSGRVLLWDAAGNGSNAAHLRVYADSTYIWFVLNAAWDGSAWVRDSTGSYAGGFRFSRSAFELIHEDTLAATFTAWTSRWRMPMSASTNSAFETVGTIQEVGRLGFQGSNTYSATRTITLGAAVTFRSRFPAAPSSITLSEDTSGFSWSGTPMVYEIDRDGFAYYSYQPLSANSTTWWYGRYTTVA